LKKNTAFLIIALTCFTLLIAGAIYTITQIPLQETPEEPEKPEPHMSPLSLAIPKIVRTTFNNECSLS